LHNRYNIPESNRLLHYLFSDIKISEKLAVYKPIGEKVCDYLDYDIKLITRYNQPLGEYDKSQKRKCPIASSIHFFNIMILESMHSGIHWHMWLFYFPIFTEKILNKLNPTKDVDLNAELPTPFHNILFDIVWVMLSWLNEYSYVTDKSNLIMENEKLCHDNGSIPKSTALALGNIIFMIISSSKVSDNFKTYILQMACRHLREKANDEEYKSLNEVLMNSILRNGLYDKLDCNYLEILDDCFGKIDHVISLELKCFTAMIKATLGECSQA
jgi:hypothetical protein